MGKNLAHPACPELVCFVGVQDTCLLARMVVFILECGKSLLLVLACEQPFSCCAKRVDAESDYLGCGGGKYG